MKNRNSIIRAISTVAFTILTTTLVMADCDYIKEGSTCGAPDQSPAYKNDCIGITYSINAPSETCTAVGEDQCGFDACTSSSVQIIQTISTFHKNSNRTCGGRTSSTPHNLGNCEQDSVPSTANQCGDCNS